MTSHTCSTCTKLFNRRRCPIPTLYAGLELESNDCQWYENRSFAEMVASVYADPEALGGLGSHGGSRHKGVNVVQPKQKVVTMEDYLE